jgi:hypothetical protein
VRYADDFIVGVRGENKIAETIKKEVTTFLKSDLHLTVNEEKTKVTNVFYGKASFLGMKIFGVPTDKVPVRRAAHVERFKRLKRRVDLRIEKAEKEQQRTLTQNLLKNVKNNVKDPEAPVALSDHIRSRNLQKLVGDTNSRGVIRTLAQDLSSLEIEEDGELNEIIRSLKA